MTLNILPLRAEYRDHMGSDLTVVNAARASFGKESDWLDKATRQLSPEDIGLIRYLSTGYRTKEWNEFLDEVIRLACYGSRADLTNLLHAYKRRAQHWAPFAHPHIQIRIQIPMFLARQFVKHQIGGVWSEESRRYITDEPGVWFPEEWHSRPEDIKQGSGYVLGTQEFQDELSNRAEKVVVHAIDTYEDFLDSHVAPEEARIVLPLNTMTTVVWTGSLLFWSRVCNQRVDSHAQRAAQELGKQITDIVAPLYPVSWQALVG